MKVNNDYCIVLSGGGARGAYQAGALRALFEICKEAKNPAPFRNLVGVSAGAINASYLAANADNVERATEKMCTMWRTLTTEEVFAIDYLTASRTALKLIRAVSAGGFISQLRPTKASLLNVDPLRDLLMESIAFEQIPDHVNAGRLNALCVSSTDYSTAMGVTFFTGAPHIQEWKRVNRIGMRAHIGIDHVMGSAAIPLFFPPWQIGNRSFGDGCLRNTAPLSPARRIGASKLIVIGVRKMVDFELLEANIIQPTLGRVLSVVINAIFMDAIEVDIERSRIINQNLQMAAKTENFRRLDILHIQPSVAPSELAETRIESLPGILRFLISALGSPRESAEILSYLTFDPIYLGSLVDLGYNDMLKQRENLIQFLAL